MSKIILGVMGPAKDKASERNIEDAFEVGRLVAKEGWILLTGGMNSGVMDAASKGAKAEGGLTVGVSSKNDKTNLSEYVDIPIITGMGRGRNYINVLSSDIVIVCGMNTGTLSEISLALSAGKKVVILHEDKDAQVFLKKMGRENIIFATSSKEAIEVTKKLLN